MSSPLVSTPMRRRSLYAAIALIVACATPLLSFDARADDAALEARVKALEARVANLEARLTQATAPAAPAVRALPATPATPAVAAAPAMPARAASPDAAAAPMMAAPTPAAADARWRDPANWQALHRGLNQTQVKALLGRAGRVVTGVFGDVWYYPDDSGGRVVFDRDGRLSEFDLPPQR